MNNNDNKKKKLWQKIHTGSFGIILFFVGFIILLILHVIDINQNHELINGITDSNISEYIKNINADSFYNSVIQPVLYNIAISLIVLGCGSLLIEVYGYASYFRKRLFEVFVEKDALAILNDEYKRKLKLNLMEDLYSPTASDSEEILKLFDNNLPNLLNSVYFSFFKITAEISIYNNIYIKKHFFRTLEIKEINKNKTNKIKILFCITCEKINGLNVFEVNKIKNTDNGKELTSDIQEIDLGNIVQYVCGLSEELEIHGSVSLEIEYTTIVPIEDTTFTLKLDKLCKQFSFSLVYQSNEIDTVINLFYYNTDKNRYIPHKLESNNSITYNDWLLPGEGVSCHIKLLP